MNPVTLIMTHLLLPDGLKGIFQNLLNSRDFHKQEFTHNRRFAGRNSMLLRGQDNDQTGLCLQAVYRDSNNHLLQPR